MYRHHRHRAKGLHLKAARDVLAELRHIVEVDSIALGKVYDVLELVVLILRNGTIKLVDSVLAQEVLELVDAALVGRDIGCRLVVEETNDVIAIALVPLELLHEPDASARRATAYHHNALVVISLASIPLEQFSCHNPPHRERGDKDEVEI